MSMLRQHLLSSLADFLKVTEIKDYCPNGLQVQGVSNIKTIITGVTASEALIDEAISRRADAIIVHHGYFWKGENECITGMKYQRIKKLIQHNINLFAFHLPLDIHSVVGNNVQLGRLLLCENTVPVETIKPKGILYRGDLQEACSGELLRTHIEKTLGRSVLWVGDDSPINTVAWCTGGGQSYIEAAVDSGVDAFVTGEVSEQTVHVAREMGIHFFSAGHHATERYGVKALGEWIAQTHGLDVTFVDIPNPA